MWRSGAGAFLGAAGCRLAPGVAAAAGACFAAALCGVVAFLGAAGPLLLRLYLMNYEFIMSQSYINITKHLLSIG